MKNIEVRYNTYVQGFVACDVCSMSYLQNGRLVVVPNITIKKGDEDYKALRDILDDCIGEVRVSASPVEAAKERMIGLQKLVNEHNGKINVR